MDLPVIISIAVGITTLISFVVAVFTSIRNNGKNGAIIVNNLEHLSGDVHEIKQLQREQAAQTQQMLERLALVEASTKSAHKRIDGLESRINKE